MPRVEQARVAEWPPGEAGVPGAEPLPGAPWVRWAPDVTAAWAGMAAYIADGSRGQVASLVPDATVAWVGNPVLAAGQAPDATVVQQDCPSRDDSVELQDGSPHPVE